MHCNPSLIPPFNVVLILLQQSALESKGACPLEGGEISYDVRLLDFYGAVVEWRAVHPDTCIKDICTVSISPTTCLVEVKVTSDYGDSPSALIAIGEINGANGCIRS